MTVGTAVVVIECHFRAGMNSLSGMDFFCTEQYVLITSKLLGKT